MITTTITKTETVPRLSISYDQFADNPRIANDSPSLLCIRKHKDYTFANELDFDFEFFDDCINGNSEDPEDYNVEKYLDQKDFLEGKKGYYIFPIDCYMHSNISFSLSGTGVNDGFDTTKDAGFIAVSREYNGNNHMEWNAYIRKQVDPSKVNMLDKYTITYDEARDIAQADIKEYNAYANGEVYCFTLLDEDGEIQDTGGNYYSLDYIKAGLPPEFKDEDITDYIIN